jgi:hypothetical protein
MKFLLLHTLACLTIGAVSLSSARQHQFTAQRSPEITAQELREHVKYLASDELAGRKTGEEGNKTAAKYIAGEFEQYGLKPYGDGGSYFQEFPFISTVQADDENSLAMKIGGKEVTCARETGFRPMGFTQDTTVGGSLVFAGYGISDSSLKYDDYANIDPSNKIVIVLRYSPEGKNSTSGFMKASAFRSKALTARLKGAAGMIFVTGPLDDDPARATLIQFSFDRGFGSSGIACITMKWTAVDSLLRLRGEDLRKIQEGINSSKQPHSLELSNISVSMRTHLAKIHSTSSNIIGFLEGNDPLLKNEVVVIGAHMDHLGMGGEGSLSPDTVAVHHGADDNASGTAGLLELAQYFSSRRAELKRSILFTAFSGEELGLLGSNYYVKHPVIPLERTVAMLNMDMVGRLKDSTLLVEGMGTAPAWEGIVRKENADSSLKLKLKPDGMGPSDHASFYTANVPVMFFFTNLHSDYHRPSDTWDKINYEGEEKVVKYVGRIATDIANDPARPGFTKVATSSMGGGGDRDAMRVSLGVMPDYAAEEVEGLPISGTRAGSPADKAGLLGGDVIVKLDGKDVKNIYDYMYLLGNYKPGDAVIVVVKRKNETVSLKAVLEARK